MAEFFTVAFDIRNAPHLQQMADDIMAVVLLHIDTAIRDGTGTYAGVQFASVFHAQQIYLVTATNDYRAVNWNTGHHAGANTNERATIYEFDRDSEDR